MPVDIKALEEQLTISPIIFEKLKSLIKSEYFQYMDINGFRIMLNIIKYASVNNWSEEKLNMILFEPVEPSKEEIPGELDTIPEYRKRHNQLYKELAPGIAKEILESNDQFFVISSGMYAGKSTLTSKTIELMKINGYLDLTAVPEFMGNFVSVRGEDAKPGDKIGADGFKRKKALRYNPEWNEERLSILFRRLKINPEQKFVIHFDEFSFMSSKQVSLFKNFISKNYPNIKVLFAGLNRNAFGQELEGYSIVKDTKEFDVCRSFVPGYKEGSPTGTHTLRYILLPNGTKILDCGFLPVVVPKEVPIVQYTPARGEDHMYEILGKVSRIDLRNGMVSPTTESISKRKRFLSKLKERVEVQEG